MSKTFQGRYSWFGYTNEYDPWFSYFLNTEEEKQLYKLSFDQCLSIGVLSSIACWCHHHRQWEKVFDFFSMPSGRSHQTKFVLSGAHGASAPVKVVADLTVKDTEVNVRLTSKKYPDAIPSEFEIEEIEQELVSVIYRLPTKNISFSPISQDDLNRYLALSRSPKRRGN
jgi:hypothetical protein